jgi:hypothetical protein
MNKRLQTKIRAAVEQYQGDIDAAAMHLQLPPDTVIKYLGTPPEIEVLPPQELTPASPPKSLLEEYRDGIPESNPELVEEVRDRALETVLMRLNGLDDQSLATITQAILKHDIQLKQLAKPPASVFIDQSTNSQTLNITALANRLAEGNIDLGALRDTLDIPKAIKPEV